MVVNLMDKNENNYNLYIFSYKTNIEYIIINFLGYLLNFIVILKTCPVSLVKYRDLSKIRQLF